MSVAYEATYREMAVSDLDAVLLNECAAYPVPWSRKVFEESVAGNNQCFVMLCQGEIVGHAVVSTVLDEFHLLNLCVSPGYQGKGLGRAFLSYLTELALNRSMQMFFLEVRVSNLPAIELYRSAGFNEVGVRPNYYPSESGREDALLMTMQLSIDHYA